MNNRLKFRVWSPSKGKFLDKSSHGMDYYRLYGESENELRMCKFSCGEWLYDVDDAIIQQFTGLKDSEGKDIYEGDLIQYTTSTTYGPEEPWQPQLSVSPVFWGKYSDDEYVSNVECWMLNYNLPLSQAFKGGVSWNRGDDVDLEKGIIVIGNILENKDLIK